MASDHGQVVACMKLYKQGRRSPDDENDDRDEEIRERYDQVRSAPVKKKNPTKGNGGNSAGNTQTTKRSKPKLVEPDDSDSRQSGALQRKKGKKGGKQHLTVEDSDSESDESGSESDASGGGRRGRGRHSKKKHHR